MDETIRRRLQAADSRARALDEELDLIARELAEKVRRETGWDVECEVGWQEGGLGELCMKPVRGAAASPCCGAAWQAYYDQQIAPLFKELFVTIETPFGMVLGEEPEGVCPGCGRAVEGIAGDP